MHEIIAIRHLNVSAGCVPACQNPYLGSTTPNRDCSRLSSTAQRILVKGGYEQEGGERVSAAVAGDVSVTERA